MGKEPKAKERARAAKDTTPTKAARETYGGALSSVLAPGKHSLGRNDGGATTAIERGRGRPSFARSRPYRRQMIPFTISALMLRVLIRHYAERCQKVYRILQLTIALVIAYRYYTKPALEESVGRSF